MLKVLLYNKVDKDIRYAAIEVLDHMGLPFEEIDDLKELDMGDDSHVLLIPETAIIDLETEKRIFGSFPSVVCVGYLPQELCDEIKLRTRDTKVFKPPLISGTIETTGNVPAPFFYSFSVVETTKESFQSMGEINSGGERYNGIILKDTKCGTLVFILPHLFKSVAYLFSGAEETLRGTWSELFDECDMTDENKVKEHRKEHLHLPIVNLYEELLFKVFKRISKEKSIPIVRKWFHPNNHPMTLCLTHDVDVLTRVTVFDIFKTFKNRKLGQGIARIMLMTMCELSRFLSRIPAITETSPITLVLRKFAERLMPYAPSWNFDEYDRVEDQVKAKSTYFLLTDPSEEVCRKCCIRFDLLKNIATFLKEGDHEVGLHGGCDSFDDAGQMIKEKQMLENVLRGKTAGVRQHLLRINVPETWRYQQKASFDYDTSFGYNQLVGFRAGTCFPFTPWDSKDEKKFSILEIPLVVQDNALLGENNMSCLSEKALGKCTKLLDVTHSYNGVITLLWHACVSKETRPYWIDAYRKVLEYASRYSPWYTNCASLAAWWRLRSQVTLEKKKRDGSELEFSVISPKEFKGFSISLHLLGKPKNVKIFINGEHLDDDKISMKDNALLFSINVSKGTNEVRICY